MSFTFLHRKRDNTISISARVPGTTKKGRTISTLKTVGNFSPLTPWEELPQVVRDAAAEVDIEIWKALHSRAKEIVAAGLKAGQKDIEKTLEALVASPETLAGLGEEKLAELKKAIETAMKKHK